MIIRNEKQALCVAVEMEKRAIRVYERALMLVQEPDMAAGLRDILREEQEHLKQFSSMKACCACDPQEDRMLIQALGAELLMPGGLMAMERAKGLQDMKGLYAFVTESEKDAMQKYGDFAARCEDPAVKEAFLSIAREEASHYAELLKKLNALEAK